MKNKVVKKKKVVPLRVKNAAAKKKKAAPLKEVFIGSGLIKTPAKFGKAYKFFVSGETEKAEVDKLIEVCERGGQEYAAEKVNSNVGLLWVVYQKPDGISEKRLLKAKCKVG